MFLVEEKVNTIHQSNDHGWDNITAMWTKPIFLTAYLATKVIYSFQEKLLEIVKHRRRRWEFSGISLLFIEIDGGKGSLKLLMDDNLVFDELK